MYIHGLNPRNFAELVEAVPIDYYVSFIILTLQIATEWASGSFVIKDGDEDIHTANERRLKVGIDLSICHLLLMQPKRTFH